MAIYFTDNQYLKTAEEDLEAAQITFSHKYYDQTATICSVATTKYLKAILEATLSKTEATPFYNTEDKLVLFNKAKEVMPEIDVTEEDCKWMDNVYGKANCTDGIHIIMPKQTAIDALVLTDRVRKFAKAAEKKAKAEKNA